MSSAITSSTCFLPQYLYSSILSKVLLGFLLTSTTTTSTSTAEALVVTYSFVQDSADCYLLTGDLWNVELNSFSVDCGNYNHGCTSGSSIMIDGEFTAYHAFQTVSEVQVKFCEYRQMYCTPNLIDTEMNLCSGLDLLDMDGYMECNAPGNYSLEAIFLLPNHTWWEDLAFDGLTFDMIVTFDEDLVCQGQFITHVYYGNDTWTTTVAASSLFFVMGISFYAFKKRICVVDGCCRDHNAAAMDLVAEEIKAEELEQRQQQARAVATPTTPIVLLPPSPSLRPLADNTYLNHHDHQDPSLSSHSPAPSLICGNTTTNNNNNNNKLRIKDATITTAAAAYNSNRHDDESVTTTSYLPLLDFSPEGLTHQERMKQLRLAHLERLQNTTRRRGREDPPSSTTLLTSIPSS